MAIDFSTDHGQRVLQQLENEQVIWLTTVARSGTPQPNPVWFQYVDGDIFIYTPADAKRLKNIVENNRVSLNFNTAPDGEDVTVITGRIHWDDAFPKVIDNPAYLEKYAEGIKALGWSNEKMSADFPVVLRVHPENLRGW
ncbi:MAG: TIGR03667 family PPOX class F420-dependent oxidoreductase [Thermomicrobiales bacterium]|nr:TIGR03667 family PPOX class F420-dependent oxidoreductase [Thermomicrobiales bacterium]